MWSYYAYQKLDGQEIVSGISANTAAKSRDERQCEIFC